MKKILFITRPIASPWDEASKNFAYNLARNLTSLSPSPSGRRAGDEGYLEIYLLTNGKLNNLPKNIIQENIYTSSEKDFKFSQKMRLLVFLIFNARKFNIVHLLFTPTKLSSWMLKIILSSPFRKGRLNASERSIQERFEKCTKTEKSHNHTKPFKSPLTPLFQRGRKSKIIQTIATLREDLLSDSEIKKMLFGDLIVTYSDYAKNRLEKLGFKNARRIYPGIDLDYYSPARKNFRFLMNNNLRAEDFIITYPGEYSRLGAIDDIVKAIVRIGAPSPSIPRPEGGGGKEIKFIFACRVKNEKDAKKKEKIIKNLKKLNLLSKVVFIDTVPDMAKLYNSSDVIIFPARDMKGKFDVPLAVIEAFACAKPVIISDIPVLQEFANRQNSVIIKSGDAEKLSGAILDLYQNKTQRETIGKTARKYAEENFDIKKIAGEYREIYESLGK